MNAAATERPTICAQAVALLRMLTSDRPGVLFARTSGITAENLVVPDGDDLRNGWLPRGVLARVDQPIHVRVAAFKNANRPSLQPSRLGALVVHATFPKAYVHPKGYFPDGAKMATAHANAEAFVLPPTIILQSATPIRGGGYRLSALWALQEPISLETADGIDRARQLLMRLSGALFADPVVTPRAIISQMIALPGTPMRERTDIPEFVTCRSFDADRRYTVSQIDAALNAHAPTPSTINTPAARGRGRQE